MWLIWIIAGIILVIAEMTTFTFYLLWLGVGAFASAVTAHFSDNILIQILVGCAVALILTIFTRPLTNNVRHSAKGFYDPYQNIVGKNGTVTETIAPHHMGQVRIGSEIWSATATEEIPQGAVITVIERNSTILQVQASKENPS